MSFSKQNSFQNKYKPQNTFNDSRNNKIQGFSPSSEVHEIYSEDQRLQQNYLNLTTDKNELINQYRTYQQRELDQSKISNNQSRRVSENFPHHTAAIGSQKSNSTSRSRSMQEDDLSRSQDTSKKSNQQQFLNQTINDTQSSNKKELSYQYLNEFHTQDNKVLKESFQQNRQIDIQENDSYVEQVFKYNIEPHQFQMSQLLDGRVSQGSRSSPSKNHSIDASGIKRKADQNENINQSGDFNTIVFNQDHELSNTATLSVQRAPRYKNSQIEPQKQKLVKKPIKFDPKLQVMKTISTRKNNYDSIDHLKSSHQKSIDSSTTSIRKSLNTINSQRNSKQTISSTKQISCQSRKIVEDRSSQKYLGLQPILKSKRQDTINSFRTNEVKQADQITIRKTEKKEISSSSDQNQHSTFNHTLQINNGQFYDFSKIQADSTSKESITFKNLLSDSSECIRPQNDVKEFLLRQQNDAERYSPKVSKDFTNLRSPHFAQNSQTDLKLQEQQSSGKQKYRVYLTQPQNQNVYQNQPQSQNMYQTQPQQVYTNIITQKAQLQQEQFQQQYPSFYENQYYLNDLNQLNCDIDCLTPQNRQIKSQNFVKTNVPHPEQLKQDLLQYSKANNQLQDQYNSKDPKLTDILGGCTINSDPTRRANTIEIKSSSCDQSLQDEEEEEEEEETYEEEEEEDQEESQTEKNMTQILQQIYQPVVGQQKYVSDDSQYSEVQNENNSNVQTQRSAEQQNQNEPALLSRYAYGQFQNNFQNYDIPYNPNYLNSFVGFLQNNTMQTQPNELSMNNLHDYNIQFRNNVDQQHYNTQVPQTIQNFDQMQFYQQNQVLPIGYSYQQNYTKKSDMGAATSRNSISSTQNENFIKKRVRMPTSIKKRSKSQEPTRRSKKNQQSMSIKSQSDCTPRNIMIPKVKRNHFMSQEEIIQAQTHSIKRGRVVKKPKSQYPSVRTQRQKSLNQNGSASRNSLAASANNQRAKSLPKNLAKLLFKPISDVRQILQHLQLSRHSHILTDKGMTHISQLLLLDEEALKQLQVPKQARIFILSYTRQYKKYLKKKFGDAVQKSVKSDSNRNQIRSISLKKYVGDQQTERQQKSQPKAQICKFIDQVARQKLTEEQVFRKLQSKYLLKKEQKLEIKKQKSEKSDKQKKPRKNSKKQKTLEKILCCNCNQKISPSRKDDETNDIQSPYNIINKMSISNSAKSQATFCICNSAHVLPSTLEGTCDKFYEPTSDHIHCEQNDSVQKQLADMMVQSKNDRVSQLLQELERLIGEPIKIQQQQTPMFSAEATRVPSPVDRLEAELNKVQMHNKSFQFQNENNHMNKNSISMKDIVTWQNTFCNQDLQVQDGQLSKPQISRNKQYVNNLSGSSDGQITRGRMSSNDSNDFQMYNQPQFQNQMIQNQLNSRMVANLGQTSPSFQSINHFSHITSQVQSRDDPLFNVEQSRYNADKSLQFQQTCLLNNNQNINNFTGTEMSYDVDMQNLMGSFQSQNDQMRTEALYKKFQPQGTPKNFQLDYQQTDNSQTDNSYRQKFNNHDLMFLQKQDNFVNQQQLKPDSLSQSYMQDNFFHPQKYQPDSTLTQKHNPFSPPQTYTKSFQQSTSGSHPIHDHPQKQDVPYKQKAILPQKYQEPLSQIAPENSDFYKHDLKYLHKPENLLVPQAVLSYKNEQILDQIYIADQKYKQACEQIKLFHQKLNQVQQRMKMI